jgi:long-chain acyl-CoA synthetase
MPREEGKTKSGDMKPWFHSWPNAVPKNIDYPLIPLSELLSMSAKRHTRQIALVYFDTKITYQELEQQTNKFANALIKLGIKKGARVALFLPNIPPYIIAFYGTLKTGAIVTPISSMYKEREAEHQLIDSGAVAIVALDLFYPIISNVIGQTNLKTIIIACIKDYMPKAKSVLGTVFRKIPSYKIKPKNNVFYFRDLLTGSGADAPKVKINPAEDLAVLQYTGGTTGIAKGAMLTHLNLVSNSLMCAEWIGEHPNASYLSILPLFHVYGMTTGLTTPFYFGAKVVLFPLFSPKQVLRAIKKYKITVFCGVPTLYAKLISHPDLRKFDCSSLQYCISGSSSLSSDLQRNFMEQVGGLLVEGYGLSESSPITHCNPLTSSPNKCKVGSIGIPWPDTDARIVDQEKGERELEPDEIGEIVVRGPQVMKGYWNMPEETAAVLRDGWLFTGDLGKMDEDGYFYFVDRKKDLIKCNGYSVYPKELETVLEENPAVKVCCVVGKADKVAGEVPKAFVVLREGYSETEKALMSYVNCKVAKYKAVQEIEFRSELPLTMIGKVNKAALKETYYEQKNV